MKKKVLLIAALLTAGMTFAQEEFTSKKGVPILPEAGDYALGFDATNFLSYGGNLMNGTFGNSFNNLGLQPDNQGVFGSQTIYGKYFKDSQTAYRGLLRLGYGSTTDRTFVTDVTDPGETVEDKEKVSALNITIGGGYEMRRGAGRLQGVYGPIAMISFGSGVDTTFEYGNDISDMTAGASRTTEANNGGTFSLALGGFAGVEYFFAPKFSLGAEIMWTIRLNSQGDGERTVESWDGSETTETTTETGGQSSFGFDTRPNANLSLNFHF